jgi:type II secretory pathway component PulJ
VRRRGGFTAMELVVTNFVFGLLLFMIVTLEDEMMRHERKTPINYLTHPEVMAVVARLRRDVVDSYRYPPTYEAYRQNPKTLILESMLSSGFSETVVWDFNVPGQARRLSYTVGNVSSDWLARGTPQFEIDNYAMPNGQVAVRLDAWDERGALAIDQIMQPRAH